MKCFQKSINFLIKVKSNTRACLACYLRNKIKYNFSQNLKKFLKLQSKSFKKLMINQKKFNIMLRYQI